MTKPQLDRGAGRPSRRERVREATLVEIKEIARRHLVEQGAAGVSLRAIAREMGMTAPGLYRYVSGIDSLLVLITADMFGELAAAVAAADASVPSEDTDLRILTSLRAFRSWAVTHRAEFATMFGPRVRLAPGTDVTPALEAGRRFGATFYTLFDRLLSEERFPLPDGARITPELARELRAFADTCGFSAPHIPVEAVMVLSTCWVRLYGVVCMEVFEHMNFVMRDMEPLFESELQNILTGLGVRYQAP
ncbi:MULTISPECIES: TetR/AcrR family transcriptional regulator [Nocardiopsis]|uniref:AcrR family transcriptional regulator n=1 Tax=Nocardiopsis sinuspersici TaxID=501010 RepID=A0A1V3C1V9_9ACTN|nr:MULTISPECIES: TetR/AcrR family transcriptional regulator [Nocardiopsis]NYH50559.1 AcrR family transcriptional regulator [Nocardiopsis sinuspersici]OOC54449.1 TetR family transcriptional regulator [Nocardiopsis sinuspersici]